MYRDNTIGVVVTAYNEEALVGTVIDTMPAFVDRVYVIDDGSSDGTWEEIIQRAVVPHVDSIPVPVPDGGQNPGFRIVSIQHDINQGVGGAIKTGFHQALSDEVDLIAVMDGDGQMDPSQLNRLLDPIIDGKAKYTKGNRLSKFSHFKEMSRLRFVGNAMLTVLTKVTSGYWHMSDPQNGYNAIAATTLERLSLSELYDDYGFRNDMLVRLNAREITIADVAMPAVYGDEESDIYYREFIPRLSRLLLRRFPWRLREKYLFRRASPGEGSYIVGSVSSLVWIVILIHVLLRKRSPPSWIGTPGWVFCVLLLILAMTDYRHRNELTVVIEDNE
jgi:glycosyltransferase involved in cell wall biosynthesis